MFCVIVSIFLSRFLSRKDEVGGDILGSRDFGIDVFFFVGLRVFCR